MLAMIRLSRPTRAHCMQRSAWPVGWTAFLANTVGLASMSRPVLTAISLSVMAAILGSFAVLLIEAWSNRVQLIDVLLAVGVSLAIAIAAPVLLSRDLFSYAAYGRIYAIYHHNPYIFVPA